ncbi:MAG: shikimate dehydrogenase [Vicinamibacteria bacterium]
MARTKVTRVVAAVMAPSMAETLRAVEASTGGADLIELRVDAIRDPDLEALRLADSRPLIFTCRSPREGGVFRGSETERREILRRALELGFDYVDIELDTIDHALRDIETSSRLILSHHAFDSLPDDLPGWVDRAADWGADVLKLAGRASSLADVLRLGEIGPAAHDRGLAYAPITMGPAGVAGRVLASRLGAEWTYAAARGLTATGPGQLDLDELLERYRFRSIDASTQIYGIVGLPVQGSLSPVMHNDSFGRRGLNAVYVPFEEEELSTFVEAAKDLGVAGLSVTRPFKEAILPFLDDLDHDAKAIGAVNTVSVRKGKWLGFNTDAEGAVRPIARRMRLAGKRAVILGAGGAARAAAVGLRRAGAKVVVLARNPARAKAVADVADGDAGGLTELARRPWDILINATPLASGLLERGREPESLRPGAAVLDMVYEPQQTELLEAARQRGAMAIPGLEMLVAQAVRQAEIWTGSPASEEYMELAAREELSRRAKGLERVSTEERISRKSAP